MIDFRYHLVSIVAVFLALTIGIVLGTTALQEPVIRTLRGTTSELKDTNEDLRQQVLSLQKQNSGNDAFVQAMTPRLVAGKLRGERVVVVVTPGADNAMRDAVMQVLNQAGATVTGTLAVEGKYLADDQQATLAELTGRLKPAALDLPNGTVYDRAGAELADAIVTKDPSNAGREYVPGGQVLAGFTELRYVSTAGRPGARATLAVVIAPKHPFQGAGATADAAALVALAKGLKAASLGTVVVGDATATNPGGVISALRNDDRTQAQLSSVDAADLPAGRVVAVYALLNERAGNVGHYGLGPGTSGFLPTPPPSS